MKRLLGYLKEHLCVTILAPLFKMLEASFELFVPLVVASMIDVGIGHHDIGYLWKMGGLLILLGIIGFFFCTERIVVLCFDFVLLLVIGIFRFDENISQVIG